MRKLLHLVITFILLILVSPKIFGQGGDNAAAAAGSPITLPFSAAGTTCGKADNYNFPAFCTCTGGKDWLYYFCAPTSGVIDIFMNNAYGVAPAILVYNGVPNASGSTYVASSITGSNINSLVSLTVTAGNCFYIMIDNDPSYADLGEDCFSYSLNVQYHTNPPAAPLQPACTNVGYDAGNLSGWVGTTGVIQTGPAGAPTPSYVPLYYTTTVQQQSVTSGASVDPFGGFPTVNPAGGTNSVRLGDYGSFGTASQYTGGIPGACGATLEQKFTVTASNALFVYYYAVVIQDANSVSSPHTPQEQPFFKTDIYDCAGVAVACGQYLVTGGPGIPGFTLAGTGSNVYYKNWSPVAVDLTPYIGTCVTVRYTVGDCSIGGHFAYAYVDASCSPLAITGTNKVCPTKSTTLTAPVGLFTYSWTPGGATTQSIVVTPTTTTNYTCELTSYTSCKTFLTYSVSLFPPVFASATSETVCNGTAANITTSVSAAGGTYAWSPGGTSSSSLSVSPPITTSYTCTYTDLNGCQDTALSRVTVNPLPIMVIPPNVSICNNASVSASSYTSNVVGTTYDWVNSNASIGLAASGTGNTPGFTGINIGTASVNAVISVTPTANSCVGTPVNYTITVNPIPTVNAVPSGTYCNGILVPATTFTGNIASTTYSWANTNTTIGLAGSGIGNISGFSGINTGVSSTTGVVTVTPSAFSCIGTPTNFSITVNPIPTVTVPISGSYCNGDVVPATTFSGNIVSTTFDWSNTNSTIGISVSGTGNIASFGAVNNGAASITGVISVTPTVNSCVGNPQSFSITVNPIPTVSAVPSNTYCSGALVPTTTFTGNIATTTYSWSNTNSTIGISASGVGNISSFSAVNNGSAPITGVISVTPAINSCVGTPINYTITVNPIPTVNTVPSGTYCNGILVPATTFTGNIATTTYSWANTNTTIGLAGSGTGNISGFSGVNAGVSSTTGVVTVTPSAFSCIGTPTNFSITVNPIPTVTVPISASYCNGDVVPATTFSGNIGSTTYDWSNTNSTIGIGASGTGNIASFTAVNNGSSPITGVISVTPTANSCIGNPQSFSITVNPIPTVNAVPSGTYCNGILVPATTFTGNIASTTYSWVNTNTTIGLAAGGTGNISGFSGVNAGVSSTTGVVTVTPSAFSCIGTPTNFSITVNPIPTVTVPISVSYCNGDVVPATTFSGNIGSTTYDWSNTNSTIGIGASGTGNIASFSAVNNGSSPITGVISVTPTANSCIGNPQSFSITVNPIPTVNAVPSGTYCNGILVPATTFTGNIASTSYSWANTNTTIGLAGNGSGNISGFSGVNAGVSSTTGVVTVTPSAFSCIGTPTNFSITVNPIPTVTVPISASYCNGDIVPATTFSGNIGSTTYNWSNTNSTIGIGASGAGNIASFSAVNNGASAITGVISVTPTVNSCDGNPQSFSITVNPTPLAPTALNTTICPTSNTTLTATAPGGTYTWYDAPVAGNLLATNPSFVTPSLTLTTIYYVKTTNAFGCVSPFTPVTANVLNFLTVTASADQTICIGTNATLSVTPSGVGYSYSWDSPGNAAFSNNPSPVVTPITTTMYSVTVISPNGCTGSSQTQVVVNPLPIANAGSPISYCNGQSGTIGSLPATGYLYSWVPTSGLSSPIISNPLVTIANAGSTPSLNDYTLTVTLNGCQSTNTVEVTVNPIPVSNAGGPIILCAGQSGTIGVASTNGYSYAWTPATNLSSSSVSNPTVTGVNGGFTLSNTIYTVTTSDPLTLCQSTGSVTVSVLPLPVVSVSTVQSVCEGVPNIPINGTIGGSALSGIWSGGLGSINPNNTSLNGNYSPTSTEFTNGSVTLTLTAIAQAPCQNVSSVVTIGFYKKPVVNYTVNIPKGCPEHCVVFADQSSIVSPDFIQQWSWDFGDGGTSPSQNPSHCYSNTGVYTVSLTVISNHLCSSQLTIPQMIEVYAMPIASFVPTPFVAGILDPNIDFQNTSQGAVTYFWNFGDYAALGASNTSTVTNPSHAYTYADIYNVNLVATSVHGCVDIASVSVEIKPEFTFYIPNCFTPGSSDGVNDIFYGMGIGIEKYEMWIFDRWGANIFYSDDIYKGWNGKVLGKPNEVQQDVYIWKVKLKDVFGKNHEYIGHVTLLR